MIKIVFVITSLSAGGAEKVFSLILKNIDKTKFNIILAIGKKEVLDYAKHNDLKFLDDETNADDKFRRNWLRNTVIPMLEKKQPQIKKHLQLMSSDLQKFIKIK